MTQYLDQMKPGNSLTFYFILYVFFGFIKFLYFNFYQICNSNLITKLIRWFTQSFRPVWKTNLYGWWFVQFWFLIVFILGKFLVKDKNNINGELRSIQSNRIGMIAGGSG